MKKTKIDQGQIFAIPLKDKGYGLGLIARKNDMIALGYFFKTVFEQLPIGKVEADLISKANVILIGKFSCLGISNNEWPLLKSDFVFKKDNWPIPFFKGKDLGGDDFFSVLYDDSLLKETRRWISKNEAENLFEHGLYGYGALEIKLSRIIKSSGENKTS